MVHGCRQLVSSSKRFKDSDFELKVDFKNEKLIYPIELTINENQTCNFKADENFVVFECVCRLLMQGYRPRDIELEPKWKVGHGASGGRADIWIRTKNEKEEIKSLLIIECKKSGNEFTKAWSDTQSDGGQIFSYFQQERSTEFLALYASDFVDGKVVAEYKLIKCQDNEKLILENETLKSYKDATSNKELFSVWSETYSKEYATTGIFENNKPYEIGVLKPTVESLKPIGSSDIQKKYNEFAEILRKYNVSGRENAFDKLVNLFLCKAVDEQKNKNELMFYWKGRAYDTPFDFQDRLQKLYKIGMDKFLNDEITYIANDDIDEAFEVFQNKSNATKDAIKKFFRQLKFFTNNDFAFIDVHNEKLFYQNFTVLLDIAKMIQDIRITGSEEIGRASCRERVLRLV